MHNHALVKPPTLIGSALHYTPHELRLAAPQTHAGIFPPSLLLLERQHSSQAEAKSYYKSAALSLCIYLKVQIYFFQARKNGPFLQ